MKIFCFWVPSTITAFVIIIITYDIFRFSFSTVSAAINGLFESSFCYSYSLVPRFLLSFLPFLQALAEKGGSSLEKITAHPNFLLLATMNPGGDYGKKELSPALRNRFTEIWVPSVTDLDELRSIALKRYVNFEMLTF